MDDMQDDPQAPERLIEGLRALYARPVPREVDDTILSAARRRMVAVRRRPRILRWVAAGAVAAAALVAVVASLFHESERRPVAGRVTILDAFALARRIEAGAPLPADDVNHDGRVNRADVDHLAMAAVALPPRAGGGR